MLTLVIGGSASGKSEYAERHVLSLDGNGPGIYIASMEPFGEEAQARIARHHAMRRNRGFETMECCRGLGNVCLPENSMVLLEDLGNLVANELFGADHPQTGDVCRTLPERLASDIENLLSKCGNLTIVTNEVFSAGKDYGGETLTYLRVLAGLNRKLAEKADVVTELVCGLPEVLKGAGTQQRYGKADRHFGQDGGQDRKHISSEKRRNRKRSSGLHVQTAVNREQAMIFVTGPLFAGKQEYIMKALGWDKAAFEAFAVRDVQDLAADVPAGQLQDLADTLAERKVVIATEVGGGVVPVDPEERRSREAAGRLACLLAERADTVIRVCCGLPRLLKGDQLP